ncbi:MAG: sulfurtransferase [Propionibacteriales bacterium]|nr:sulfurtransferase [Propionibacteriales bacterium]
MSSRRDVLVSVNDLPDAVNGGAQLLDVRWRLGEEPGAGYARYLEGHLPSARFLDLEAVLCGPKDDATLGRHPLPSAEHLAAGLGALGIDPERPVVVYDEPGSFAAARAWWVLTWAGLSAWVLDGGIQAWTAADGGLLSGPPASVAPTSFTLETGLLPTLDADEIAAFDGIVMDVRAGERYRGEVEPIDRVPGHIPGAINRPVADFFDENGLLPSAEKLDEVLDLPADRPLAVYCGSGVSAAQVVLALASLGIEAALYPPSWSGWSADPARPVAVGAEE